jgi:GAF domain-containing protein
MQTELDTFSTLLHQQGVPAALAYLNGRTPHRYTGLFRFDGDVLRNEALFDRSRPGVQSGDDAPMAQTFCALVGREEQPVEILDASMDPRARDVDTTVLSYCGVLIRDDEGQPFGTLCHYDTQRGQQRTSDQPLLEAAAAHLYQYLHTAGLLSAAARQ